ncbi:hypothetical protein ACROYT_G029591 [Oculina patagonica]
MTAPGVTGLATGVFILVLSQVISSVAAETAKLNGTCDGSVKTLANGCSISSDCSTIKCEMKFVEMPIIFKLKVNKCGDKVSATTTVEVPDLHITWSHVYTSNEIVQVPGFTTSFHGIIDTGVFVQVELSPIDDKLHVTVNECDGVSATVGINVPDLNINWSHTFTSDGIIAIPGFTVSMTSIGTAGV